MIRPQPARWFEAVVARDDAFLLLEALAASGCAEIEWHVGDAPDALQANLRLKDFADLARRFRAYWPAPHLRGAAECKAPAIAFEEAVAALRRWSAEAAPVIAALQARTAAQAELDIVERVVNALDGGTVDLEDFARARSGVRSSVLVYPEGAQPALPGDILARRFESHGATHALVVGPPGVVEQLEREASAVHGRSLVLPEWLSREPNRSRESIAARRAEAGREIAQLREALDASLRRHEVALALGDVARASWCFENVGAIHHGEVLARITGWTSDRDGLLAAVESSGARAVASFPPAPAGARAPLLLRNPWWARPFELFARLFGMPGGEGADPTMLLAIVSPLLFGYMFGDVGQGLVILAAGVALRKRMPAMKLLIPGGLAAIGFGFVFGSVFGVEGVIHPLWVEPFADPLKVLVVPLFAGAALLAVGLALKALEAFWRRQLVDWLRCDAGFAVVYAGVLVAPFHRAGLAVAAVGAAAFVLGHALHERRWSAAGTAVGALVEHTLQILVNTLSFARVGAFALGHAGLSAAVVALAHATGGGVGYVAALVLGNAVIILLEGMVVGIQTTRLILFEFFLRFFDSRGREFHPLSPPIATEDPR